MRIPKLVLSLILVLSSTSISTAGTVPLTGKFRAPSGRQFNGYIRFSLPFAGAVDTNCDGGGSCLALPLIVSAKVVNGAFDPSAPAPLLIRNGDIQPLGTYYRAFVYDSNSALVSASNFVIAAGVGSFDVGAALQTAITTNNVSYINPANLFGNNTWTGTNTFNGPVIFNSTVTGISFPCGSSAAANTVCGNNTGAPTGPSYVKVAFPMTDGTTIAPIASPTFTGTPQAPTPAAGDNSNKIATTAFVNSQTGTARVIASVEITTCAINTNNGSQWWCEGTASWGVTLPDALYRMQCFLTADPNGGGFAQPDGRGTTINWISNSRTTTQFQYHLDGRGSGSNGAGYKADCLAIE